MNYLQCFTFGDANYGFDFLFNVTSTFVPSVTDRQAGGFNDFMYPISKYVDVSESKVPYFFATKILHIIRCLFLQLLLTSFTIFSRSQLLCWCTCLGGKSILRNPVDRRWTNEHVTMRAPLVPLLHCHVISWHPRPLACVCVCVWWGYSTRRTNRCVFLKVLGEQFNLSFGTVWDIVH